MTLDAISPPTTRTVVDGRTRAWPFGRRVILVEQLDAPTLGHRRRWAVGVGRVWGVKRADVEQVRRGADGTLVIVTSAGTVRYTRAVGMVTLDSALVRQP